MSLSFIFLFPQTEIPADECTFQRTYFFYGSASSLIPSYIIINLLRSLVVKAEHRHRTGVDSIPARGPIVDEFF